MLSLSLQRSPRRPVSSLQEPPGARLQHSASAPRLAGDAPCAPPPSPRTAFVLRPAGKHHVFPPDIPYPLACHRGVLACDALDHKTLTALYRSASALDVATRGTPARCLDLGCGPGAWVLEAAREWPECRFVGFDVMNLQIPAHRLARPLAGRIQWVHGDFLQPLPFADGAFDHVHIRQIARGVPEDKWDFLIAEVARVLTVGGTVEIFEEDIIFPVLPRSATATAGRLESRRKAETVPSFTPTGHFAPAALPEHDHAVLEALFYRVFERRFINLRPTALILGTLDIHMRLARASPLINFPRPPPPAPHAPRCPVPPRAVDRPCAPSAPPGPAEPQLAFFSDAGLTSVSATASCAPAELLPAERLAATRGTLGLNLYRSWQGVVACRDAMWHEFRLATDTADPVLDALDWDEHELKLPPRTQFDLLLARYQADMEAYYPIAHALVADLHWTPPRRQIPKEDLLRLEAVAAARRDALILERSGIGLVPERSRLCRKARIFVARKGSVFE